MGYRITRAAVKEASSGLEGAFGTPRASSLRGVHEGWRPRNAGGRNAFLGGAPRSARVGRVRPRSPRLSLVSGRCVRARSDRRGAGKEGHPRDSSPSLCDSAFGAGATCSVSCRGRAEGRRPAVRGTEAEAQPDA